MTTQQQCVGAAPAAMGSSPHLLTQQEAAAALGIGSGMIRREIREKRLKVCRLGYRTVRIPRVEIERWIERRAR